MVDKLTTKIITIPMCLHGNDTKGLVFYISLLLCILIFWSLKGFPSSDEVLCTWLFTLGSSKNQNTVAKKLHGFIYSVMFSLDVYCNLQCFPAYTSILSTS